MAKYFAFFAFELVLLVTPMVFPTIPFEIGMLLYGVAIAFAVIAALIWWKDSPTAARSEPIAIPSVMQRARIPPTTPSYPRSRGLVDHNLHTLGHTMIIGSKDKTFVMLFSVSSRGRVNIQKGPATVSLARVRDKKKGDRIVVDAYPNAAGWFAVNVGEHFVAVNEHGYVLQGIVTSVSDDRHDEFDMVSFKYLIVPKTKELTAI